MSIITKKLIFSLKGTSTSERSPTRRKIEFLAKRYDNSEEELDFFYVFRR